ncbi:MAG: carboxypeptidase regulatory-like domain-containing protein [Candidatus Rokubacteria bacterium]|nr:carboxypeptidase regulatory-like domain-containing protein [Candidatus Rokubacteria bacterium]
MLANAAPESMEYRAAKSWLADAWSPATSGSPPAAGAGGATAPPTIKHVERTGDAGLYGRVAWSSEPGGPPSIKRMQVHLTGVPDTPTTDQRYTVRTDEEGRYEFKRIVGGPYKLSNRVAGKPTWRLRVEVEAGRDTALDLTPGNSITVRDDFPETAQ